MEEEPYTDINDILLSPSDRDTSSATFVKLVNDDDEIIDLTQGFDDAITTKEKLINKFNYIKNKLGTERIKKLFSVLNKNILTKEDSAEIKKVSQGSLAEQKEYLKDRYNEIKTAMTINMSKGEKYKYIMYEIYKANKLLEYTTLPLVVLGVTIIMMGVLLTIGFVNNSKESDDDKGHLLNKRDKYNNSTLERINTFDPMLYDDTKRFGNNSTKRRL